MNTEVAHNKYCIIRFLTYNNIEVYGIDAIPGPSVTLYKVYLVLGNGASKTYALSNDLAVALGVTGIRVVTLADCIGVEVPNQKRTIVTVNTLLKSEAFQKSKAAIPLPIGVSFDNQVRVIDLAKAKNILIAGAPGQGKTTFLNAVCECLSSVAEERNFRIIPDADDSLDTLCKELAERSTSVADARTELKPRIIAIIHELAYIAFSRDLMKSLYLLAQKGPKVGINLIVSTSRPCVDTITNRIMTLFQTRIAFRTISRTDSMVFLDRTGAEKLTGNGDLLLSYNAGIERLQGAFVEDCSR